MDCDAFPRVEFSTRDNASSISDCEYGDADIMRGQALIGAIKAKHPQLELTIDTCDEWVLVSAAIAKNNKLIEDDQDDCRLS